MLQFDALRRNNQHVGKMLASKSIASKHLIIREVCQLMDNGSFQRRAPVDGGLLHPAHGLACGLARAIGR